MPRQKYQRNQRNQTQLVKKIVKKELAKEIEFKDYNRASAPNSVTSGGVIEYLTNIAGGTNDSQRIGNEITIKSLDLRYEITAPGGDVTNIVRVILFRDMSAGPAVTPPVVATTPIGAGVLQSQSDDPTPIVYITNGMQAIQPFLSENRDRYKILMDRVHTLGDSSNSSLPYRVVGSRYIKKNMKVKYYDNNANSSDRGSFYLMFISDSSAIAHPVYTFNCKFIYTDA